MIYPIILYGDTVLRDKCAEIERGDIDIKSLVDDMFETMSSADGIGLAAPQIGISKKIFVVDGSSLEDEEMSSFKKVFINPVLNNESGELWEFEEGCLSIPNVRGGVNRKSSIELTFFDENWNKITEVFKGMQARVIQHEYDHIQGKLFIDYLSPLKKKLIKNKLTEISKGNCEVSYKVKKP
ncbi:MAG: peptide deformylase [Cytophagia bacterium]|jgi:peptide deformylase|nr:peptide deformylase [Cytophagia bacterium]